MKNLVAGLLFTSLVCAPAVALENKDDMLILSPDEKAACKAGGGCVIAPNDAIRDLLQAAYEAGKKSADCRSNKSI